MRKTLLIFTLLSCILVIKSQSTDYKDYYFKNFPKTPSTNTFLRYGDIKNSEFTGTNSPQIDLLSIISGKINIPISLRYISGNGIKTSDEASSVGLGWDINFPTISQIINGGYDDFDKVAKYLPPFSFSSNPYNNYFPHERTYLPQGFIQNPAPEKYSYFKTIDNFLPLGNEFIDLTSQLTQNIDTSPDIFICNLFGEKLEFLIQNYPSGFTDYQNGIIQNPTFYCLNKKGYKISYDATNLFTIIDPEGSQYYFEKVEIGKIGKNISKNFRLTKIIDINNNVINIDYFDYQNILNLPNIGLKLNYTNFSATTSLSSGSFPLYNSQYFSWIGEFDMPYDGELSGTFPFSPASLNNFLIPIPINYSTSQNYLLVKSITGNFGIINFKYSDRLDFPTQKLDNIELKDQFNVQRKNINFIYDYFESNNSPDITTTPDVGYLISQQYQNISNNRLKKRLKLLSVKINDEQYSFEYDNTLLPPKHSIAIDYWGYSNGGTSNKTIFLNPTDFNKSYHPLDNQYNNNFKQSNLAFTRSAILTKIIYPTSGYSLFEYELNSADNLFNPIDDAKINIGNGLRLKSQTNYDWNNQFSNKVEFEYYNGKDTNPLFLINNYTISTAKRTATNNSTGQITNYKIVSINSSNANSASSISSGNYIGYSRIIKKDLDNLNNSKGKIETYYTQSSDYHYFNFDNLVPINLPSSKSLSDENGKINQQFIYDKDGNIVSKTINTYSTIFSNTYYGVSLSQNSRYVVNFDNNNGACMCRPAYSHGVTSLGYYPIFSKESLLTNSYKYDYYNGKNYMSAKTFSYNSNNFLTNEKEEFPDGTYKSSGKSYSTEWNHQKLINNNIIGVPIYTSYSNNLGSVEYLTKYEDNDHLNPTSVIKYGQRINGSTTSIDTIVNYTGYDNKGNLIEYKNIAGVPTTIVWGYNQTQPIAKIEGATYAQVLSALGVTDITQADIYIKSNMDTDTASEQTFITALDTFRNNSNLSNYQITTYSYDPLIGVTTITPPSGIREIYHYNAANRLDKVTDVNGNILKEYTYHYKQ